MTRPVDRWYTLRVPRDYPRLLRRPKASLGAGREKLVTEPQELIKPLHAPGEGRLGKFTLCGAGEKRGTTLAASLEYVTCKICLGHPKIMTSFKETETEKFIPPLPSAHARNRDRNKGLMDGVIKRTGQEWECF